MGRGLFVFHVQSQSVHQPQRSQTMKKTENTPLDMLESLLSITGRITKFLDPEDYAEWQRISARTADLRMISDGGDPKTDI